jgi:hypothetical protein
MSTAGGLDVDHRRCAGEGSGSEGYDGPVADLANRSTFPFKFDRRYLLAGMPFGISPATARVVVTDRELFAQFGPWRVRTLLTNVTGTQVTGPYSFIKTAGPAHLSFTDRGMTMATNGERGLCIRFAEPVRGLDPLGRLRHPGLTVTVAQIDELAQLLAQRAG